VPALFAMWPEGQWVWMLLGLLSIPVLVMVNGLFVAAEFALVAVRRTRIEELVTNGSRGPEPFSAPSIISNRSIAATQLGITLASIALGWSGEPALAEFVAPLFGFLPEGTNGVARHTTAGILALLLITFMHVVFGELIQRHWRCRHRTKRLSGWGNRCWYSPA